MQEFSKDPMVAAKAQRNNELFLKMAEELETTDSVPSMVVKEESPRKQESQNIGPKYMSALENVLNIADIKAIEIELPILKTKVEVSSMTSEEELALKTSSVSPEGFLKKIDEILYKHCKFQNNEFDSYFDFLDNLYPPDKSLMIWALLNASYLVLPTVETICESCENKYIYDAKPQELIHGDSIEEIWTEVVGVDEFKIVKTVLDEYLTFNIKMPNERTRLIIARIINPDDAKSNLNKNGNIVSNIENLLFFIDSIEVGRGNEKIVLTDILQDIYPFLKGLPPKITDAIKNEVDTNEFDKYMPKFYLESNCARCDHKNKIDMDPEIAFFRKALSI